MAGGVRAGRGNGPELARGLRISALVLQTISRYLPNMKTFDTNVQNSVERNTEDEKKTAPLIKI